MLFYQMQASETHLMTNISQCAIIFTRLPKGDQGEMYFSCMFVHLCSLKYQTDINGTFSAR
jgi:hypothetical protein